MQAGQSVALYREFLVQKEEFTDVVVLAHSIAVACIAVRIYDLWSR